MSLACAIFATWDNDLARPRRKVKADIEPANFAALAFANEADLPNLGAPALLDSEFDRGRSDGECLQDQVRDRIGM
jgi:hypothetical protein